MIKHIKKLKVHQAPINDDLPMRNTIIIKSVYCLYLIFFDLLQVIR